MLSMRTLKGALDVWDRVDMQQLRAKSLALTGLFIELVEGLCAGRGLALETPRDPSLRGSQVAFRHDHAYEVMQALIARGVIGDFRAPSTLRFGFTPLYLRYVDVLEAAETLADVLATESWRDPRFATRTTVT